MPAPDESFFSSIHGTSASRPNRNSWPTCPMTTTKISLSYTAYSALLRLPLQTATRWSSPRFSACTLRSRAKNWAGMRKTNTRRSGNGAGKNRFPSSTAQLCRRNFSMWSSSTSAIARSITSGARSSSISTLS